MSLAEQIVALIARSIGLQQQGENEAALACLDEALALAPEFPVTLVKRGTLLMNLGRPRAALADFDLSMTRQVLPHLLPLRDAALHAALRELECESADAASCCECAALLERLGRDDEAEARYRRALELDGRSHAAWIGLGNLLLKRNRHAEALACYEVILAWCPNDFVALFNRGNALQKDCRFDEALSSYAAAEAQRPDFAEIRMEQAHCHLAQSNWLTGWPLFESRWQTRQLQGSRLQTAAPQWYGEALPQATLLLWAEQGLGDCLQFLRYLPATAERSRQVVLRMPGSLLTLCRELSDRLPNVTVVSQDDPLPGHDAHCPLMSLPLALGAMPDNIPHDVPYVFVPASYTQKWRGALATTSKRRIAIVWSGGQRRLNNPTRDMPLSSLLTLLDSIDADWFALQKDISDGDALLLARYPQIRLFNGDLADFADTAAILAHVDLLISADTAVAHLAGALGTPTWLVLRKASEWRWLGQAKDCPWYPGHRLFHQMEHGDWRAPVQMMKDELARDLDCQ